MKWLRVSAVDCERGVNVLNLQGLATDAAEDAVIAAIREWYRSAVLHPSPIGDRRLELRVGASR